MNVQSDRQHVHDKLTKHILTHADEVGPTGNAYVGPDGTLWYEFSTMDLSPVNFWATNTRHPGAYEGTPKLTIAHNRAEMDDFQ